MRARVLSLIGWFLISLWSMTLRVRFVKREIPAGLKDGGRNIIYAFWHGRQFLLFYTHRNSHAVIPASESRDGEIQAGILKRFGFDVVRGSSKRKGERALLGLVDALRNGKDIALAVDGPRGPIYEVKQGITYLAGKLDKPIVPVVMAARGRWILEKIWDKYLLPHPFTRCIVLYGEPVIVNGTSAEELENKRGELTAALNKIMDEADRIAAAGR
ncbi:MAG: lysophospholipid acyltransferase family protein [Nitrospiraceae bacterium]|nr:lysophospholipid acyltransferase family protein [Nitrospiraceae bacterium]